jgi:hypothetical protein
MSPPDSGRPDWYGPRPTGVITPSPDKEGMKTKPRFTKVGSKSVRHVRVRMPATRAQTPTGVVPDP